ncbi:MAG TPA: CDP-glycerol glycerophosphotransferase family protein [Mycobacteriales bacterium]|nr:CDP-glycerol glycerophosphotransferase family protein [Mycobacteriales bacterium]
MPRAVSLRDRDERRLAIALVASFAATIAVAIGAAAVRSTWGTFVALAASVVVELMLSRRSNALAAAVQWAGAGPPARTALRLFPVVLLAGREFRPAVVIGTTAFAVVVVATSMAAEALRSVIARMRRLPLVSRNLDLGDFAVPELPPAWLTDSADADAGSAAIAALGLALAVSKSHSTGLAAFGLAVAFAVAASPVTVLGLHLSALMRAKLRARLTEAATTALETLAPEVLLYFDATPEELYQVRMWLDPIGRLGRSAAIVLRSYEVFDALTDTTLPIVCSPYNGTIASIPLPSRVVVLFPTHSGNNLSMLRRPETRSAFIGHGDSDKPDSVNPFARVYDEVWVAGALGRRRYEEAGVGVADGAIVEVGRPQVEGASRRPPKEPTIVYAPTWEGWGDDPHHSSLGQVGLQIIERLVDRSDVRVRYRPHPLTGRRDPRLRAAHRRIVALVGQVPPDEPLATTLAGASGLIGDVSSVINEFLPYDRPYAVPDTRGLGSAGFVARFPSAAAAFVIGPDLDRLDAFVAAALGGPDPTSTIRGDLLEVALGDPSTGQQRFADAVGRLLRAP